MIELISDGIFETTRRGKEIVLIYTTKEKAVKAYADYSNKVLKNIQF